MLGSSTVVGYFKPRWQPKYEFATHTLVGALIFGFAVCTKPEPGVSAVAALTGPAVPPNLELQPLRVDAALADHRAGHVGLYVSRYLAAYQLGYIPGVWDPFFAASSPLDPRNGTEDIITSWVSKAWPVSDRSEERRVGKECVP